MSRKPRLVAVDWDDVTGHAGNWHNDDDIDDWADTVVFHCTSVGWLLRDNPDHIVLAARATDAYLAGDTDHPLAQVGDLTRIPRVLVSKIRTLTHR